MSLDQQFDSALDLNRRLPPADIVENLDRIIDLVPDLIEDLLSSIDQPLRVATDKKKGKEFLLSDYNRDGDSYRSPWSNEYFPRLSDGIKPSDAVRRLEIQANEAFDVYRELYYEGGISSVYLWDNEEGGFDACVLIKKVGDKFRGQTVQGVWDSINIIEIRRGEGGKYDYTVTSTVILSMITEDEDVGSLNLSGSLMRQRTFSYPYSGDPSEHIENMGKAVEEMENRLRNRIEEIYFGQTFSHLEEIRTLKGIEMYKRSRSNQESIMKNMRN